MKIDRNDSKYNYVKRSGGEDIVVAEVATVTEVAYSNSEVLDLIIVVFSDSMRDLTG